MTTRKSRPPENRRRTSKPRPRGSLRRHLGRWSRRVAELSVLVAAVVGLVVLGRWTHAYVTTSEHFAVDEAEITGSSHVPAEEVQRLSGLAPGTNIFAVSPGAAARRIEQSPWIESATVRRRLPSQVTIEVTEREAIALVRMGKLFLIDGEGTVCLLYTSPSPRDHG